MCGDIAIVVNAPDLAASSPKNDTSERFHSLVQRRRTVLQDVGDHSELAGRKGSTHVIDKLVGNVRTRQTDDAADESQEGIRQRLETRIAELQREYEHPGTDAA